MIPSHLLNDVYTRPGFELDENEDEGDPNGKQEITSCLLKDSMAGSTPWTSGLRPVSHVVTPINVNREPAYAESNC